MKKEDWAQALIEKIPELKEEYEENVSGFWKGESVENIGLHNIFGDVLDPFLIEALENKGNDELLTRIFSFLEEMAISPDPHIREVLAVTVLERVGDDKALLKRARKFMKEETRKASDEVEKGWGRYFK